MGIALYTAKLLKETISIIELKNSILQLGKQDVYFFNDDLPGNLNSPDFNKIESPKKKLSDIELFKSFGFDTIKSVDFSTFEGSDYQYDLNLPVYPHQLANPPIPEFDVVFDGGTLEHVFNVPQALKNAFNFTKVGGVIIHNVGSHNYVDHGFYSFSPTFFYDYYEANGFEILQSFYYEFDRNSIRKAWIYNYTPTSIDHLSLGGWGTKPIALWFVVKKTINSTCSVIPSQRFYSHKWLPSERNLANINTSRPKGVKLARSIIRRGLKRLKLYDYVWSLLHRIRPRPIKVFK